MSKKYIISKFGVCVTISAICVFTFLLFKMFGWPGFIIGPIVGIAAMRPAKAGGPCGWMENVPRLRNRRED